MGCCHLSLALLRHMSSMASQHLQQNRWAAVLLPNRPAACLLPTQAVQHPMCSRSQTCHYRQAGGPVQRPVLCEEGAGAAF